MTEPMWVPVPQSLEYDLITHAIQHGEIPQDYRICRLVDAPDVPQVEGVAEPDGPGWWAFEGSEWGSKAIYLEDGVESGWREEWNEEAEEHWNRYEENLYTPHHYEPILEEPFQTIVKLQWVHKGQQISNREQCGPYNGEPVLGFLSPKYRWSHIPHGIDTWCGKWYRLHMPWEQPAPAEVAQ